MDAEKIKGVFGEAVMVSTMTNDNGPNFVLLTQSAASMYFQFHMSPSMARELAGKLISAANASAEKDPLADLQSAATDVFAKPATVAA